MKTRAHGIALLLLFGVALPCTATTVVKRNLAELVALSETILVGDVVSVTDGFDDRAGVALPYTEITIEVSEGLRGAQPGRFTLRQFGLLAPRELPDGRIANLVSPPGLPRFEVGERVLLFVHGGSERSGLRTTVGLGQGKFVIVGDVAFNEVGNRGLFDGVVAPPSGASRVADLAASPSTALPADELLELLREAIAEGWFP